MVACVSGTATSSSSWGRATVCQVACKPCPLQLQEAPAALAHLMRGTGAVLLQREVPEHVNEAVAAAAAAAKVPVLLVRRLLASHGSVAACMHACMHACVHPAFSL